MNPTNRSLLGIHHVTAITGAPQENVDFYVGILGLRLVKRTVNQDDPGTYHLFYADAVGSPGTDLTFFAWPDGVRGREGVGQATAVSLAIPQTSLEYWTARLREHEIPFQGHHRRFDEDVIAFSDTYGQALELVAARDAAARQWQPWKEGPVPPEHAIRGIHSVTIAESGDDPSASFLSNPLGFWHVGDDSGRKRFGVGDGGSGAWLDLVVKPLGRRGSIAVGTIHHIAWRTPDDKEQQAWWQQIRDLGVPISEIIDRFWFHSIYFREPGGVLFEIATDGPGFLADETVGELGTRLVLPPWLEPSRDQIERALPPIELPQFVGDGKQRTPVRK